jgi:hypothetical protein
VRLTGVHARLREEAVALLAWNDQYGQVNAKKRLFSLLVL